MLIKNILLIVICCVAFLAIGCGDSKSNANLVSRNDTDLDLILDGADNCPSVSNPRQSDIDSNGIGDACDPQYRAQVIRLLEN